VQLGVGVLALLAGTATVVYSLVGNGSIGAMAAFVAAGLAVGHALGGPRADEWKSVSTTGALFSTGSMRTD
jgi:hypothetical protein